MHRVFSWVITAIIVAALGSQAQARDEIRIVGSSTVFPFAASVAEHFGKLGDFRTPVVEATGSGAGFKLFCSGIGSAFADITDASRRILPSERALCESNNIHNSVEVKIGYDGITLANSVKGPHFNLTKKQLFLALARKVPENGQWVENHYSRWKQIDPTLPDLPIKIYGTPPVSGTRDTFVELVMDKGCSQLPETAHITDDYAHKTECETIREDGVFIEAGENGNLIAQKLVGDPQALGIFGYSFLDQNTGKIQGSGIEGVEPSFESIQNGSYTISRPLYFYVKKEHIAKVPGIRQYVETFLSDAAIGEEGYLIRQGLVPMKNAERTKIEQAVLSNLGTQ